MTNSLLVSLKNENTRATLTKTLAGEGHEIVTTTELDNKILCYLDSPNLMPTINIPSMDVGGIHICLSETEGLIGNSKPTKF